MSGSSDTAKQHDVAERRAKAVALKAQGLTYDQIAEEMGYSSRQRAHEDVKRALEARVNEQRLQVDEWRELELEKLDALERAAVAVLGGRHVMVSHGRVIVLDGEPLQDSGPVLAAINSLLKVADRRAKLLGLDAPVKVDATVTEPITYINGRKIGERPE